MLEILSIVMLIALAGEFVRVVAYLYRDRGDE